MRNTIILITSDHGEDLFEPNTTLTHGVSFNGGDQGNLVPCILYVPGKKPKKINNIVRNIDITPTLLNLAAGKSESNFEGANLSPYINEKETNLNLSFYGESAFPFLKKRTGEHKPLEVPSLDSLTYVDKDFNFHIVIKPEHRKTLILSKERCLRTENWKIVFTPLSEGYTHRLYDLKNDPQCTKNVSDNFPSVFKKMKYHLWEWILKGTQSSTEQILKNIVPDKFEIPSEYQDIKFLVKDAVQPL